jgi:hypothetical protein
MVEGKKYIFHQHGKIKKEMIFLLSAFFFLFFSPGMLNSQVYLPLQNEVNSQIESQLFSHQINFSTFLKPYSFNGFTSCGLLSDSIFYRKKGKSWLIRKLFYEPLIQVDSIRKFSISADPLFNFSYGHMNDDSRPYYHNIRGALLYGNLKQKLFFESSVLECQSRFPMYLSDFIFSSDVVPGMGQGRRFGKGGFDYSIAHGFLEFAVSSRFQISLGTGKLFAGDGYRSLLLSDVSFNYPYLHINYNLKQWHFSKIFAVTMSDTLPLDAYGVRTKRLSSFDIISYTPASFFEVSLFDAFVYHYPNLKKSISLDPAYFNPVIFSNLLSNDSTFASLAGINIRLNIFRNVCLYHQIAISNPHYLGISNRRLAVQTGIKFYNFLTINNLYLQAEYNWSGRDTYVSSDSLLNYSNYNQPLAHPLGNNFREEILRGSYRYRRFDFGCQYTWSEYGSKNISKLPKKSRFVSEIQYNNPFISQGPHAVVHYYAANISYIINFHSNRKIEAGFVKRTANYDSGKIDSEIFYFSFKTDLYNFYPDF